MKGHRIDGEIPAGEVLPQAAGEGDPVGVAEVGIAPFPAEGRNLQHLAVQEDADGAVAHPHPVDAAPREGGDDRFRRGGGGEVPVVGGKAHRRVPDAAAHCPALPPGRFQRPDRLFNRFRPAGGGQPPGVRAAHRATGANCPRIRAQRASGSNSTWVPILPPLTMMVSWPLADWSIKVGNSFFIPTGEQPPRT